MDKPIRFLIIDGYPKESRDDLEKAKMELAWKLYRNLLLRYLPGSEYDVVLPSDEGVTMPGKGDIAGYGGIIWTGCNLSIFDKENQSVLDQIEFAKKVFEVGVPSFGSCWGLQIAAVAAGGKVEPNPRGKEMGLARKVALTHEAAGHPMYEGKPSVFEAYISHDDMVTEIPEDGVRLAGNDYTHVQALAVTHKKGTFWATQYHPEYDLNEMACLIVAREQKLIDQGFYKNHEELEYMVERMKALYKEPDRKDLRWQLVIDDDVLSDEIRQCEFKNWINKLVVPYAKNK